MDVILVLHDKSLGEAGILIPGAVGTSQVLHQALRSDCSNKQLGIGTHINMTINNDHISYFDMCRAECF